MNVSNDDGRMGDDGHSPLYSHKRSSIKVSLLSLLDKTTWTQEEASVSSLVSEQIMRKKSISQAMVTDSNM